VGWLLMLQTTSIGAASVTSRPYSASPTVRAAGNTNRPYREHYKGGFLVGCPSTVRAVQMLAALTVWGGTLS